MEVMQDAGSIPAASTGEIKMSFILWIAIGFVLYMTYYANKEE